MGEAFLPTAEANREGILQRWRIYLLQFEAPGPLKAPALWGLPNTQDR